MVERRRPACQPQRFECLEIVQDATQTQVIGNGSIHQMEIGIPGCIVQVLELLQTLRRQYGMTILLVTNDDAVAAVADRMLRLRDGVITDAVTTVTRAEAPRSERAAPPATSDTEHR